uniref:Uncharacterized protein n=1 Tax=Bulbochaete rectangularis var. hiloensis TaxID=55990 RepID=A0A6M4SPB1_9CHLO|nr:hypothetical protein [Bulbochaete rectangularis var. hiloensis]
MRKNKSILPFNASGVIFVKRSFSSFNYGTFYGLVNYTQGNPPDVITSYGLSVLLNNSSFNRKYTSSATAQLKLSAYYEKLETIFKQHKEKYPFDYNKNPKALLLLQEKIEASIIEALNITLVGRVLLKKNKRS